MESTQQLLQEIAEYRHEILQLKEHIRMLENKQFIHALGDESMFTEDPIDDRLRELETAVNDIRNYIIGGQNI